MNPDNVAANVVPYVQVRHAIHLLYATSPRSRDGYMSHRYDKDGNRLPLELHGCGCSLCARRQLTIRSFWTL
ncbi:MAG TPA: hypothetical protein VJT78_04725 [Candidatus Dormibacteraeota bacterium]|nr:hypothetical protein [Candidatus Dormibacteraeota bacterium]